MPVTSSHQVAVGIQPSGGRQVAPPAPQQHLQHGHPCGEGELVQTGEAHAAAQPPAHPPLPSQGCHHVPQPWTPERQRQPLVQVHPLLPSLPQGQTVFTPPWKANIAAPFQCVQLEASGSNPTGQYMGPGLFDANAACTIYDAATDSYHALASVPLPGTHPNFTHHQGGHALQHHPGSQPVSMSLLTLDLHQLHLHVRTLVLRDSRDKRACNR